MGEGELVDSTGVMWYKVPHNLATVGQARVSVPASCLQGAAT